ncbi:translation metalloprotein YbeY [Catonella morbi ATCC 51271]|uniref:Endoribonuclease YbeY n=1 Tax=Catonella morbi ATCC 51271 TaxID=592026 RepID=V2ZCU1_9FIRM|nr:rRNA maturation RNase YbeY [Catonella morbi]ESL04745.1 translation metalloprotein YbeY [Catonella morbi ATCC 51271]
MTILVENEAEREPDFDYEEVIKAVIEKTVETENCPYEIEVNVLLTGNDEIQEANRNFRDIDRPTDVLSFPMVDYSSPSDFSTVNESPECYLNPETDELVLGDIMISVDKVYEQAEEYGHSRKREFAFLIAHSMLHLLGYDHMEDEERVVMEAKQEAVLEALGITRNEE